jgi:hypothetical protein
MNCPKTPVKTMAQYALGKIVYAFSMKDEIVPTIGLKKELTPSQPLNLINRNEATIR